MRTTDNELTALPISRCNLPIEMVQLSDTLSEIYRNDNGSCTAI